MDARDPFLAGKGISTSESRFSFPLISDSVISVVDVNINLVWTMAGLKKTTTPRFIIEHVQRFFSDDDMRAKDMLWKEHCAGDLRELADSDWGRNFPRFLANVPKESESDKTRELYSYIRDTVTFLHSFHHLNEDALDKARTLLGDSTLSAVEDRTFDKICADFISALHSFFKFRNR